uniref:Uncharacterized protein n=1 Tax=Siphoviridae sp. ctBLh2 TaxID=2827803 RepID=A0A8S5S3M1_9CAUD|nr:MAG TPA: hypothetical protein [Siphoviridae sp. ctBLh2]
MSAYVAQNGDDAGQGAVDGEPDQTAPFDDFDHEAAGQASRDERGEESGYERPGGDAGRQLAAGGLEQRLAEDWCEDHEERELGYGRLLVAEQQSGGDGRTRTRESGHGGTRLRQSDDEGVAVGDCLPLPRPGIVGEGQQGGRQQQHGAYEGEDPGGVEQGVDLLLEQKTDDADRDHRDDDLEDVGLLLVETAREEPLEQAPHLVPEHNDRTQHGGGMQDDVEREVLFDLHAQQLLGDLKVPAARDGKKFGDALHDAEQDGLQCIHGSVVFLCGVSVAFQNGIDLQDEAADHEDRGQRDPPPREHGVVEFVGRIAAASRHQYEAEEDDGKTDGQQDVVAAREGHAGILLCGFRFLGLLFFHLI